MKKLNNNWELILLFLISFVVYLLNIYPEITNGDSGELLSAAYTLGIAHPPGYPLYLLLLKFFIWFFPFNPAMCGNIMSSFFASLAVMLIYKNFLLIHNIVFPKNILSLSRKIIGMGISLFTGITPILFSQAIITEVYTLNLFLMLLNNLIFLKIIIKKNIKFIYLFSFIYGLSLSNHQSPVLLLPIYGIVLYKKLKKWMPQKIGKIIIKSFVLFIIGLSLYIYLIIRANANPLINWGNPSNISRFFQHITRAEYKEMELVKKRNLFYFLRQYGEYFKFLWQQFNFVLLFGLAGLYIGLKKNFKAVLLIFVFWLILSAGFVYITNPKLDRHILYVSRVFFIPSFVVFSLFIFLFFAGINNKAKWIEIIPLIIFVIFYFKNINSQRGNFIAYDFSRNILKTINKESALFTVEGDNPLFALAYLRFVEYLRPDIDYCNRYGKLFTSSVEYFKNLISIDAKELYFTSPERIEPTYQKYLQPIGVIYKLVLKEQDYKFLYHYYLRTGKETTDYMDKGLAAIYYYRLAVFYKNFIGNKEVYKRNLLFAAKYGDELKDIQSILGKLYYAKKDYKKAKKFFKRIIEISPEDASGYFYYGMCELKEKNFEESLKYLLKSYNMGLKSIQLYKALAFNFYKLRRIYETVIYLEEGLKIYPQDKSLKEALKYYNSIIE